MKLLEVEQLDKSFVSGKKGKLVHAVDHVSFVLNKGEFLGLVGESGCGKSTVAQLIMGLLQADDGSICLKGKELFCPYQRSVYRMMQMVFQMPRDSFDPRHTIGECLTGVLKNFGLVKKNAAERAAELLRDVGLKEEFMIKYPHQMSGGECQRAAIARAVAVSPEVMVCDEITSALDVSVQAQIVELLQEMKERLELSMIFISHDLALVQGICDRILVMRGGSIVERGTVEKVLQKPDNEYTKLLISSVLNIEDM